ncbi:MAG: pyridoxamine 5'-phosphate oxidase family protein [Patescibacteria group bacterium]|mgnify:CR=1 FL=1
MKIPQQCLSILQAADGKALATFSAESGAHVVPVSSIRIEGDTILLVNYFFGQTLKNIEKNPRVSLAAWQGLEGFQIKATARHEINGEVFDSVVAWIKETIPSRVVKGVVVLTPTEIYDVSADSTRAGTIVF